MHHHNAIRIRTMDISDEIAVSLASIDDDVIVVQVEEGYLILCDEVFNLLPDAIRLLLEHDVDIEGVDTETFEKGEDSLGFEGAGSKHEPPFLDAIMSFGLRIARIVNHFESNW